MAVMYDVKMLWNSQLIEQAVTTNARLIDSVNVLLLFLKIAFTACTLDLPCDMAGPVAVHPWDKEHKGQTRLPHPQLKTSKLCNKQKIGLIFFLHHNVWNKLLQNQMALASRQSYPYSAEPVNYTAYLSRLVWRHFGLLAGWVKTVVFLKLRFRGHYRKSFPPEVWNSRAWVKCGLADQHMGNLQTKLFTRWLTWTDG